MSLRSKIESIEDMVDAYARKAEGSLVKGYRDLLKEIRHEISEAFRKYSSGGVLVYSEMQRYDRLKRLERELANHIRTRTVEVARSIRNNMRASLETSYYATGWALETEAQARLRYGVLKPETLTAMLQDPVSGLPLNERLANNRRALTTSVRETLTQGLRRGTTYREVAGLIQEDLERDATNAMRVVRTEAHRAQEQGKLESLKHAGDHGVETVKRWVSARDERVRAKHSDLDGQEVPYDQDFTTPDGYEGPAPGLIGVAHHDINCRCIHVVEVVTVERAEAPELAGLAFEEWKNERLSA